MTATASILPVPLTLNAVFDLVAAPSRLALAGLVVVVNAPVTNQPTQLGTPAAITLRPSGSPAGVGLNIAFSAIPNTFDGLSISLNAINSTFDGLRYPSSCPASPADVTVTADSYQDPTVRTASAPLRVTGCSGEPFAPAFTVSAIRDAGDTGVQIVTTVTQTEAQATTGKLALALPLSVVEPDAESVLRYNLICINPASGTCRAIGTAVARSPLYPALLSGTVYLTGHLLAPAVTITFPPPFPITLDGTLNLGSNTTTFTGIPDIPLTNLRVTLAGGPAAAFLSRCETPSGTATATLTTQNGDRSAAVPSAFTVADCVPPAAFTGGGASRAASAVRRPGVERASLTGLAAGRPGLRFTLVAGRGQPKLSSFTVLAPAGLRFVEHRIRGHEMLTGISLTSARIRTASLRNRRLVVTLRRPVATLGVMITRPALSETSRLRTNGRGRLRSLKLGVIVRTTAGRTRTVGVALRQLKR
ncbi:MAG TPA: hypothetical protein VG325_01275 [Solirubrobacteraceae bacterium]|nr:hypothetical protein [Solirubrobacteraceae bacterium]